jgi:hypothetical protein
LDNIPFRTSLFTNLHLPSPKTKPPACRFAHSAAAPVALALAARNPRAG